MKLLIEKTTDFESVCVIEEETGQKKGYYIEGLFLQGEIRNHNRRLYPKSVLAKEVARYTQAKINDNQAVGELGHPDSPTINLDRVSHKILSLTEAGNDYVGKAKIIDSPFGKIVKTLIDEKIKFGVSSRGLGSLKESNGTNVVQDDFFLVTPGDIVADPSAPDAFVTGLMENKEWAWCNGKLVEKESEIKKKINNLSSPGLTEAQLLKIFEYVLSQVNS